MHRIYHPVPRNCPGPATNDVKKWIRPRAAAPPAGQRTLPNSGPNGFSRRGHGADVAVGFCRSGKRGRAWPPLRSTAASCCRPGRGNLPIRVRAAARICRAVDRGARIFHSMITHPASEAPQSHDAQSLRKPQELGLRRAGLPE